MLHFFATAVFEVRAPSREAADRAATAVFQELRHPHVRYREHNISGSLGPVHPRKDLFFTVIGDFDVDAPTEDKASNMVEETLDALSTDAVQYLTHGLVEGEQRGRVEKEGREERPARRKVERKEEHTVEAPPKEKEVVEAAAEEGAKEPFIPSPKTVPPPVVPEPVHPPLFSPMRVTVTVTLQASELAPSPEGDTSLDEEVLAARAMEEARQRYPEIPAHLSPQCSFSPAFAGERLITLTWEYEVPLPSSSPESKATSSGS